MNSLQKLWQWLTYVPPTQDEIDSVHYDIKYVRVWIKGNRYRCGCWGKERRLTDKYRWNYLTGKRELRKNTPRKYSRRKPNDMANFDKAKLKYQLKHNEPLFK